MIHAIMLDSLAMILMLNTTCAQPPQTVMTEAMTTTTSDQVTIYGEPYFGDLDASAPLILLFHQGGSNGRGEYADLAPWLNRAGFRAIAWDLRAGGDRLGGSNRTVENLAEGTPTDYCSAYPDLQAALEHVTARGLSEKVVVWGSSYTGSLVFRLAAEHPDKISGVIAFSPASGGPMVDCRARLWVDEVTVPVLVFRPASEMTYEPSVEQRDVLTAAGVEFRVVENGVHGSSMLVDDRTEHDMGDTRAAVLRWLEIVFEI